MTMDDSTSGSGPFDIIGDVHGCADELEELLDDLGYRVEWNGKTVTVTPPTGRRAVFLGDLVDRGPRSPDTLRIARHMVENDHALAVVGNHDDKLMRHLAGRNVTISHGLAETIEQLREEPPEFLAGMQAWLGTLPSHHVLDHGKLIVAHAGFKESLLGRTGKSVRAFCMYGETTGEIDEFGLPVRGDWAAGYAGKAMVVYGHTPVCEAEWVGRTVCIDTGCVFGGKLTALRYPELELVSVPARRIHCPPTRPLKAPSGRSSPAPLAFPPNSH